MAISEKDAIAKVQKWLRSFFDDEYPVPFVLNVAGPQESKAPGIQVKTRRFMTELIRTL